MKIRLDEFLVKNEFAPSKSQALNLIKEGLVEVDGKLATKGGKQITASSIVNVLESTQYVSRGAKKLLSALSEIDIELEGTICGDFGASTGGFSQVLLEKGAKLVYAIDVGSNQLHESLKGDSRIVNMENQNIRDLESLPHELDFACADLSFISLRLIIEKIINLCRKEAFLVLLFKPQFEVGRENLNKQGVVSEEKGLGALEDFIVWIDETVNLNSQKVEFISSIPSKITGQNGNQEYLVVLEKKR